MNLQQLIADRRDGKPHSKEDFTLLAQAACDPATPDYLVSAWLMAAYLNPLDQQQTAYLTQAMADSGERMDLTGLPKPWVDKHSTGGVGDKTTLLLLPILAACGLTCIKMSGRGLGITGGTIDKLESIEGFRTNLSPAELKAQAAKIGLALTGQTPNLAPADKVLYALRDVTGTVASLPLIVSSVLSKKIAAGAETIVLDVKCGSGAFMKTEAEARELATWLKEVGADCGVNVRCVITDMEQPLGAYVGSSLEVMEAMDALSWPDMNLGPNTKRLRQLCFFLAGTVLEASGLASTVHEGFERAQNAVASKIARAKMLEWLIAQGAKKDVLKRRDKLTAAPVQLTVKIPKAGYVSRVDAAKIGQAVVNLGGGRKTKADTIDHLVGMEVRTYVGAKVTENDTAFVIYAATQEAANEAAAQALFALEIQWFETPQRPLIISVI